MVWLSGWGNMQARGLRQETPHLFFRCLDEVDGEERFELVQRDKVGPVVKVNMAGARDDVHLLGLGRRLVGVFTEVSRMRVLTEDEQQRPRRDGVDVTE